MAIQYLCPFPVLKQGELEFKPDEEGQFADESFPINFFGTLVDVRFARRTR